MSGSYSPPPSGGRRESLSWLAAATLVLIAAVVVIEVVLTRGGGSPQAGGSTSPSTTSTGSTGTSSAPPTGAAPTNDTLPDNAESSLCNADVKPEFVAVAVVSVLAGVTSDTPDSYAEGVLDDCASAAVRSRISQLYGVKFGTDYSDDLTNGNNAGPSAAYTVGNAAGTATLRLDLTKQHDGHYEVTDYTYG